jgi:type I restriction enzyme R subunit
LFQYVQLFVISNGTETKYYSNTTRHRHIQDSAARSRKKTTSNSFEFTSWWADASNRRIADLRGFTSTFFAKHTLLNILTRYCVFDVDRKLLVMRPYQIVATEQILQRIATSTNHHQLGTTAAGGYVWHATGSGKTLTSFKTAQLASRLEGLDKVLFVVDRKDLDYQTMREYERFEKGAANSNVSTAVLKQQLEDPSASIIITTIQKLARFVAQNAKHPIYDQHVVVIFDECHRSQFGDMHVEITRAFKRHHLFGFTGTPIFADNAGTGGNVQLRTTAQAFGDRLHHYTIVDAINDRNVLPFRVDYVDTIKTNGSIKDKSVPAIDRERALLAPERIAGVVDYLLEHFDQKTRRTQTYLLDDKRVLGFNALFATASIDAAKRYYAAIKEEQARRKSSNPSYPPLTVALIYSFAVNEDDTAGFLGEEQFEASDLDQSSRDFLEDAIRDYNANFATNFDTSAERFQNYYKDLALRLKNREVDLVVVVNMFLTGFDATTLNTLWVDKNLRQHGLIQAFSRTNRILNSVKTYGNIVSFRNLEDEMNEALALFGNKDAKGIVLLKPYAEYVSEYEAKVAELLSEFPVGSVSHIVGEERQKQFIKLFGSLLRLLNILVSFDDFAGQQILSDRDLQDYRSAYLDLYADFRQQAQADKESINDDVIFEIELVKQVEVNVDYILMLVKKYIEEGRGQDREIRAEIARAIDSSPSLRNKKDLIEEFIDQITLGNEIDENWQGYIGVRCNRELESIIRDENLSSEATLRFIAQAFREGSVPEGGTAITEVLPPTSRFSSDGALALKKQSVVERLSAFVERFAGLD